MQIQASHAIHKLGWTPAYDWWADHQMDHAAGFAESAAWVETVPVMPATVLGLELLLQERCLDLQMASDLILRDPGATLHIMLLMQREWPLAEERPSRMVDCLAALDIANWFAALSTHAKPFGKSQSQVSRLWKHCRSVAHYAKLIAESLGEVSPEEAYLAGLLHEVENIPHLLGGRIGSASNNDVKLGQLLPCSLVKALDAAKQSKSGSIWRYVLASAHSLATAAASAEALRVQQAKKPFVV